MVFYGCSMGLDLMKGTVRNNLEAGVIEPAMSKVKIIQVRVQTRCLNYLLGFRWEFNFIISVIVIIINYC